MPHAPESKQNDTKTNNSRFKAYEVIEKEGTGNPLCSLVLTKTSIAWTQSDLGWVGLGWKIGNPYTANHFVCCNCTYTSCTLWRLSQLFIRIIILLLNYSSVLQGAVHVHKLRNAQCGVGSESDFPLRRVTWGGGGIFHAKMSATIRYVTHLRERN